MFKIPLWSRWWIIKFMGDGILYTAKVTAEVAINGTEAVLLLTDGTPRIIPEGLEVNVLEIIPVKPTLN